MALVAYDNSDSSEFEDDDSNNTTVISLNKKVEDAPIPQPIANGIETPTSSEHELDEVSLSESGPNLFNLLPQPSKKKPAVVEEDDEFLHKKANTTEPVKPKVKITVPSLSDFRDVEDRPLATKPKISNGKKSGLLSILPQPRNAVSTSANTLVPNVLKLKPNATVKKKEPLSLPMKKAKTEAKGLVSGYSDESDNDEDVQNDFFSINKPVEALPEDFPVDIDLEKPKAKKPSVSNEKRSLESYFKKDVPEHVELKPDYNEEESNYGNVATGNYNESANEEPSSSYSNDYAIAESSSKEAVLDEEAILKLCGARGKRKREEIQIVDVNQQEVLANAREMLLKGLMDDTSKRVSASKKRGNEPTSQQKRKHQITYLAHQAKANEAELQNQWANNRMTKRQTQSKYGF